MTQGKETKSTTADVRYGAAPRVNAGKQAAEGKHKNNHNHLNETVSSGRHRLGDRFKNVSEQLEGRVRAFCFRASNQSVSRSWRLRGDQPNLFSNTTTQLLLRVIIICLGFRNLKIYTGSKFSFHIISKIKGNFDGPCIESQKELRHIKHLGKKKKPLTIFLTVLLIN